MSQQGEKLLQVDIEKELRQSYLEYSLSVIVGRAIPDARDGLKPVHRRILFSQQDLGNYYNRPHKKSARIVGDVIGKYHPHGDSAVYDALVRMAQDFSMHLPLIDGQGNFGSIDGDPPAAMRYTEVRMSRLAQEFLTDLDKNTVDFRPNYDNTLQEPVVLPTRVPNLLLNGSSGIAVGMATNIPPHNLGELCDAILYLLDNPDASIAHLMTLIKGPDFPTAGSVYIGKGLDEAYHTGRGTIKMRGRIKIEERNKHLQSIVITEIPFGLNKSILVEKIANLINERTMEGVADLRDESDRKGIRIVLDLKRNTLPEIIINTLYKYTPLESSFGINMLAVLDNRPVMLNLKTALVCFIEHRREIIIRRTRFDLQKAEARLHLLAGLKIALEHIDAIIALIRASATPEVAKQKLITDFALTEVQAKAVIEMRLQRLTALQRDEIQTEHEDLTSKIQFFHSILDDPEILRSEMQREIQEIKELYAVPRRTEIIQDNPEDIAIEDIVPDDDVVITLSRRGYMKRVNLENYQQQKRGGKGILGANTVDNDCIHELLITSNHQYLCLFTNKGLMYLLKVHQIPMGSRTGRGVHINNLLPMSEGEVVSTVVTLRQFDEDHYFIFVTKRGTVKRSPVSLYSRGRRTGIIAISLVDNDELVMVRTICEKDQIILATKNGYSIRFACSTVRSTGRATAGMRGIFLREQDEVIGAVVCKEAEKDLKIMSVSAKGFGKKTSLDCYRLQTRGGKGVLNFRVSYKSGPVIGSMAVKENDGLVVLTSANKIIRISSDDIRSTERATLGVTLVRLDNGAQVVACDRIDESEQTVSEPDNNTLLDL